MHRMRVRGERLVDSTVAVGNGRGAVDVERSPVGRGDIGKRHAVASERAMEALKTGHVSGNCILPQPRGAKVAPAPCLAPRGRICYDFEDPAVSVRLLMKHVSS